MAFWNRKVKQSATVGVVFGDGFSGAVYPDTSFVKLAKEGYMQNIMVYRCIDKIAKALASIPVAVYLDDPNGDDEKVNDHYFNDLLKRPNPMQAWPALLEEIITYLLIDGNSYLERVLLQTGDNKGKVKELYPHSPEFVNIKTGPKGIVAFEYRTGKGIKEFKVDPLTGRSDMLQIKTVHPLDRYYGYGITQAAAGHIDSGNDTNKWQRGLLKNGARPGTLITLERQLTTEQKNKVKEDLHNKYTGPDNAGRLLLIDGVGESKTTVTPWGWSPKEMDFIESEREIARRIAFAFGVPSQLIGIPGDTQYSNYREAMDTFYEDTVFYYARMIEAELNNWIFSDDPHYLKFEVDETPALQYKKDQKWKSAQESEFLTVNEKRKLAGYEPIKGGDVIFMGTGQQPKLGEIPEPEPDPEDEIDNEEVLTEEEVLAEENNMRNMLLESGFAQESIERFLGYMDE
jgi:HK97 family phage portal protein